METEPGDLAERLREALEQQRATSEILAAISRAPFELDNTLRTILEQGIALCRADTGRVLQVDGSVLRERVQPTGSYQWVVTPWQPQTIEINRGTLIGRAVLEARTQHAPDVRLDPEIRFKGPPLTRLAVPIMVAGHVRGVLNFHRVEVAPFSPTEISLIETFADQAAIAIENVRLLAETNDALERQTAIGEVLEAMSGSAGNLDRVFEAIVESAVRICGATNGGLFRIQGETFRLAASAGTFLQEPLPDEGNVRDPLARPGRDSLTGRVLLERRTQRIDDIRTDIEYRIPPSKNASAIRSMVGVPIIRGDEILGVIVARRVEPRPFSPREVEILETFARQAAIAIENVRLFNETKEALERQTATSEVLQAISTSTSDVQPVFDALVERAARLCDADMSTVNLRVDADHYSLAAAWNLPDWFGHRHELTPLDRGTASGRVYLEGRTLHWGDFLEDPELSEGARSRSVRQGVRSLLCVPIKKDGQAIGTILLRRSTVRPFAPRQIELVETFADQAAIAIENVRLFNETREKSGQLEVANQELASASRNKSEFLANMSHELRTPLNAVIGFSDVLEQRMFGELSERQSEYVRDIASSGRQLLNLVNEILDLSKVEAGRMELEPSEFALRETIRGALTFVRERAASHAIALSDDSAPDLGTVVADERKIRQALLNLLSNAVKFTPDGGRVGVHAVRVGAEVQVSVQDTGIGIAPEDQPRVFEEFRQVGKPSDRSHEGTGLGLALAKRFIELHGGRIWIDSEVGRGTTFTFAIPAGRAAPAPA